MHTRKRNDIQKIALLSRAMQRAYNNDSKHFESLASERERIINSMPQELLYCVGPARVCPRWLIDDNKDFRVSVATISSVFSDESDGLLWDDAWLIAEDDTLQQLGENHPTLACSECGGKWRSHYFTREPGLCAQCEATLGEDDE